MRTPRWSVLRWLAAVLLACSFVVVGQPARAEEGDTPSSWRIERYHVTATPGSNGVTTVEVDLDFNFANDPGHGPFIVLVTRMRVPGNPDLWRMIDVDVKSVTSATGANTDTKFVREGSALLVRVGREGTRYRGVQNYRLTYTATGLVEKDNATSGLDEFNWTAVGTGWQVPLDDVRVTVNGPTASERTACFRGPSLSTACPSPEPGATSVWEQPTLAPGSGLQVVAGYPSGTFAGAETRFTKRHHVGNMFPLTTSTLAGAGVAGAASLAGVVALFRRNGRDRSYLGLTPGLTPAAGDEHRVGFASRTPVTVQFHPPRDARPGELGVLLDERADNRDVTATILDLAVRGHLRIEQPDGKQFTLYRTRPATGPHAVPLADYETRLLSDLFAGSAVVRRKDLEHKSRADVLTKTRQRLYTQVTGTREWFRGNPQHTRTIWTVLGVMALIGAGVGTAILSAFGWGVAGLGLFAGAIGLIVLAQSMPARTAEGSAVLAQTKGFELYLRTAEADQIRFEEGVDVFSKYLPYAVVFGVAERWTKVFQELEAQGRYHTDTSWYVGNPLMFHSYGMASMVDALTTSMSSAMNAAVASAHSSSAGGGGSGFSGGGGFGGGGGGGW